MQRLFQFIKLKHAIAILVILIYSLSDIIAQPMPSTHFHVIC